MQNLFVGFCNVLDIFWVRHAKFFLGFCMDDKSQNFIFGGLGVDIISVSKVLEIFLDKIVSMKIINLITLGQA
jgi:hypothetical protein